MSESVRQVYEVYIRTTPERLWEAITDPQLTKQYFYETAVESSWTPGTPLNRVRADGSHALEGKVVVCDPPRKLVHTFIYQEPNPADQDPPSMVTWEIEPMGEVCKLTLTHEHHRGESKTYKSTLTGWNPVLSGLKTLLETGAPLRITWPEEVRT
jgi:uncharacterized protein YndB with AHSA1/START domain